MAFPMRSYPHLDIKNLTRDQACKIYFYDFWMKAKCEQIDNENIATKFFDLAVHMGISQAVKLIQRALRASGTQVVEDGIIGSITLSVINKADPTDRTEIRGGRLLSPHSTSKSIAAKIHQRMASQSL